MQSVHHTIYYGSGQIMFNLTFSCNKYSIPLSGFWLNKFSPTRYWRRLVTSSATEEGLAAGLDVIEESDTTGVWILTDFLALNDCIR